MADEGAVVDEEAGDDDVDTAGAAGFEEPGTELFTASIVPKACTEGFESSFEAGGTEGTGFVDGGVFRSDPLTVDGPPFTLPKLNEFP